MNQTLLALCALCISMTFSLNARTLMHRNEQALRRAEVEVVLATVAAETLEALADVPFDANRDAVTATDLTQPGQFGGRTWALATDLDDFDGAETIRERAVGGRTMPVTVEARVRYVRKVGTAFVDANDRHLYKRVTLTLTGPLGATATLERVYALAGI